MVELGVGYKILLHASLIPTMPCIAQLVSGLSQRVVGCAIIV